MQFGNVLALALVLTAGAAQAEAVKSSPLPKLRPVVAEPAPAMDVSVATANRHGLISVLMPRVRPEGLVQAVVKTPATIPEAAPEATVQPAVAVIEPLKRPQFRPKGLEDRFAKAAAKAAAKPTKGWGLFKASATRTPPAQSTILPKKGSVCGDPSIRGEALAPVVGKIKACGIAEPVRVTEVAGVKLSEAATIDCPTAIALKDWVEAGLQPSFDNNPVVQLQIAGHYVCRPRNNIRGNKISEHGRGKALDISGFVLADGSKLSILGHYRKMKAIKASHKAACGVFGTTLGPGSDGHHEDHLHFDTASHRNGAYCK